MSWLDKETKANSRMNVAAQTVQLRTRLSKHDSTSPILGTLMLCQSRIYVSLQPLLIRIHSLCGITNSLFKNVCWKYSVKRHTKALRKDAYIRKIEGRLKYKAAHKTFQEVT